MINSRTREWWPSKEIYKECVGREERVHPAFGKSSWFRVLFKRNSKGSFASKECGLGFSGFESGSDFGTTFLPFL
jgi:hypothetical protein